MKELITQVYSERDAQSRIATLKQQHPQNEYSYQYHAVAGIYSIFQTGGQK